MNEEVKQLARCLYKYLVDEHDYFADLYRKNIKANITENAYFDLGIMNCTERMIDYLKEVVKEYGVEVEEDESV